MWSGIVRMPVIARFTAAMIGLPNSSPDAARNAIEFKLIIEAELPA
jgi:hypothetical protein